MITSNKLFNDWGTFFGNQTIATAILDRVLHHAEPIIINGDSYRLKGKLTMLNTEIKYSKSVVSK